MKEDQLGIADRGARSLRSKAGEGARSKQTGRVLNRDIFDIFGQNKADYTEQKIKV
jgi:hypothetical protein